MNPTDAVSRIREKFGVEPAVDGATVTAVVPIERWREAADWAKSTLGCRYFNWLSAIDWKTDGLEVVCRIENLDRGLVQNSCGIARSVRRLSRGCPPCVQANSFVGFRGRFSPPLSRETTFHILGLSKAKLAGEKQRMADRPHSCDSPAGGEVQAS